MESRSIQIRIAPLKYDQLTEMKTSGYIRSIADFCAQAVNTKLDETYEKFLAHKTQSEVLPC